MASAAGNSKAIDVLLLFHYLSLQSSFVGICVWSLCVNVILFQYCNHLAEEERQGWLLTSNVSLLSYD